MSQVNSLISKRLEKSNGNGSSKMAAMARKSATANLTSFTGVFGVSELNSHEKETLEAILYTYSQKGLEIDEDLSALMAITSEVKAINNQAALLHGERIKKAHNILVKYRDGAFTAWLISTYGNRQTPYNLMQYYEFYESLPKNLKPQIDAMPRQAVYTLASREGDLKEKIRLVESYDGETKAEMLAKIRELFPLENTDKRKQNLGDVIIHQLARIMKTLQTRKISFSKSQKNALLGSIDEIQTLIANGNG